MQPRIGVDLGGTKIETVVLDAGSCPVYRHRVATPADDYDRIIDTIATEVGQAERELGTAALVGIGTPGAISPKTGLLRNSNTTVMNGRPFRDDLQRKLGREIRIENDANCFALSEALTGAGRGYPVVFGVIIGTGTGGGIVVNGQLLNGPHAISGEWGHNSLPWWQDSDGSLECYCGKQACIETFLSGPGLTAGYERRFGVRKSGEEIRHAAEAGDTEALAMMDVYCDQLARSLAHLINILDPDAIVLGGGMSNIEAIYSQVPNRLSAYVFSDYVRTPVLRACHGDSSGVFGAAMLWQ